MDDNSSRLSYIDDKSKEVEKTVSDLGNNTQDNCEYKNLDDYEWNPKGRLTQVPDGVLKNACFLVDNGYIKTVEVKEIDGKRKAFFEYFFSCHKYDPAADPATITKLTKTYNNTRSLDAEMFECGDATCGGTRCITHIAAYIKYAKDNGFYDELISERNEYRQKNNNQDEVHTFTWNPEDADKLKLLPKYAFDIADELINRGYVHVSSTLNKKGSRFEIKLKLIGECKHREEEKEPKLIVDTVKRLNAEGDTSRSLVLDIEEKKQEYGSEKSGSADIIRTLKQYKIETTDWSWNFGTSSKMSSCSLCGMCEAPMCLYTIAAYILYLKNSGQEDIITQAKEYSEAHPNERYYGSNDFKWNINSESENDIKESIATAPNKILEAALYMIETGEAYIGKRKSGEYYKIITSRSTKVTNKDEYAEQVYDAITYMGLPGGLADYESITTQVRLQRLIGAIDYFRRKGVDISDIIDRRAKDIVDFEELSKTVSGLSRLYSFVNSTKSNSLFAVLQGAVGSGKRPVIDSIATVLCQNDKIDTANYIHRTFQQLSEELTIHKRDNSVLNWHYWDASYKGFIYEWLKPRQLYVLTGLDQFLSDYEYYKDNKSYEIRQKQAAHIAKVLASFAENTYVIIVSLSQASTDAFMEIDKRFKFTYGQNTVIFSNKDNNELYDIYKDGLSKEVSDQITDDTKRFFSEFIALNERFLPYQNDALAHYLSEYSNVEGEPVFPPDIYDKQAVASELADMIGMDAVKKQLAEFESYITFQKKATASGIKIKQGNLHMQFLGNPGTGKTTIARIVAKMLYDIGVLEENKVVEVERKDLVAQWTGQTAPKTAEKIKEAMGGVLFVDEAYSLYLGIQDTFGKEAIATLIKAMEDHKEDFIVIFAGYDKEMQDFLKANSGIESRIGYTFHFEDYTASELTEIFKRSLIKQGFEIGDGVLKKVSDICSYYRRRKNFGNGRFVKKIEQRTIINHANDAESEGWETTKISITDVPDIKDMGTQSSGSRDNEMTIEQIIGMEGVKEQIKKFQTKIRFEQKAKAAGAKIKRGNSHMLFLGNPGTGKTTIARIITKELYEAGVILENKLVEVERKDLVAEWIGQTAPKTSDVIDRAMGGVLFIDEAYSLTPKDAMRDFGAEAIATIIKAMEDHKDEFVVIFAGYEKEMHTFIDSNSGIASRIGYTFTFEDYTADELADIFKLKMDLNYLSYTEDAINAVKKVMQYFVSVPNFGNGRFAERVVNIAIELHSERMVENDEITDDLLKITAEDIPSVKYMLDHMPDGKNMINPANIKDSQNERTAIHELGHALICKLLTPQSSIEKITISAEGSGALGYVLHSADNAYTHTRSELEANICVNMAGIAAEEVFLGEYASGGTSDLETATNIARNMVMRFGMSKNGFANKKELDDAGWQEVNNILKEQFDRAQELVENNKDKIEEAKEYLLSNRTITDEEFSRIVIGA